MHSLRTILVFLIIGGAFGSKAAAYLNEFGSGEMSNWATIELGFLSGAGLGLTVSFVILFVRSGLFERNESNAKRQLSPNSI